MTKKEYSEKQTQRAIENYYNNPNYCKCCGNIIFLDINKRITDIREKKFCNINCCTTFNNKKISRTRKRKSLIWSLSPEEFSKAVETNSCIRGIVGDLGYSRASGSVAKKVKERINIENVDTSHFIKGGGYNRHYKMEEILVEDSKYLNITSLKSRLIKEGVLEYKCAICENDGEWNGKKLCLQLDHINGVHNDHRIFNIRFLCPNCHSQTETFSGRNAKANKN